MTEALTRSELDDSGTAGTLSMWPKADTVSQNQIGSGLLLHNTIPDRLWENATESESGKLVAGQLRSAHQFTSGPDPFGQNLTGPSGSHLGRFCTI